jgi:hypothetical protein
MTRESTTTRETIGSSTRSRATNGGETTLDSDRVQTAVHEVRGALEGVGRQLPEVARTSRSAIDDMFRTIESGSDERVTVGVSMSLGLAIGMLIGGAPRLLIALALTPVVAMGLVVADRWSKASGRGGVTSATKV